MDILNMLGVALGLGALAGINLYMTVFVTGLALKMGWLSLSEAYIDLSVLENPWILGVSGTLFVIEAFADKVPWVDSTWDMVHTVIRPLGGTVLAMAALGQIDPVASVIGGLLCGGASLVTHTAKAGTRMMLNTSPEPVTNIAMSTAEDIFVLGGLGLVAYYPSVALVVFLCVVVGALYMIRKTSRFIGMLWKRFRNRSHDSSEQSVSTGN